jgi:hypothetical protein
MWDILGQKNKKGRISGHVNAPSILQLTAGNMRADESRIGLTVQFDVM